jgi:phosphatidylglycerophosphatase A
VTALDNRRLNLETPGSGHRTDGPLDRVAYLIATGAGAGHLPIAPGTFGAAEGVAIYLALARVATPFFEFRTSQQVALLVTLNVLVFGIGVWAANRVSKALRTEDPSLVVIDEISGQLIALLPPALAQSWFGVLASFLLFRFFDILKPFPIRRLERLPGGLGIVADDVGAGVLAAAVVWLAAHWGLLPS